MLMIVVMALSALLAMMAFVLVIVTMVEKNLQGQSTLHRRRQARREIKGWRNAMWDAFFRIVREPVAPPPAAELTVTRAALPVMTDPDMPNLPDVARPLVRTINEMIRTVDKRIGDDVLGQPLIIEVEQIRDRHLPKLLRSYVEIPPDHRREIYNKTGRSASVHLAESLRAIIERLEDISKDLSREHIDTFEDNARFIKRTYGRDGSDPLS